MKRVRCPKCDHYNTFDETLYKEGQSLVFECENCRKQFRIRKTLTAKAYQALPRPFFSRHIFYDHT